MLHDHNSLVTSKKRLFVMLLECRYESGIKMRRKVRETGTLR